MLKSFDLKTASDSELVEKLRQEIEYLFDCYKGSIDESIRLVKKLDDTRKALRAALDRLTS